MKPSFILFVFFCLSPFISQAQSANTLAYDSLVGSPNASLSDVEWIVGAWMGESDMGMSEETWLPPSAGNMIGVYKLHKDGAVVFYEFCLISEENNSLVLRIKHFDAELHGWENQNESVVFKLVKVTPNRVYFDGLTFERVGKKVLNIYVVIDEMNKEITFNLKKRSN